MELGPSGPRIHGFHHIRAEGVHKRLHVDLDLSSHVAALGQNKRAQH
jgi:hypothetical protein